MNIPPEEIEARKADENGKFSCLYCGFKTLFRLSIYRHEATVHHVLRPWLNVITCELCDYVVLHESEHFRHIQKHVKHPPQPSEVPFVEKHRLEEILAEMKAKLMRAAEIKQSKPDQKKVHYKILSGEDNLDIKPKIINVSPGKKKRGRPKTIKVEANAAKSKKLGKKTKIKQEPMSPASAKIKKKKLKKDKKVFLQLKTKAKTTVKKSDILKRFGKNKTVNNMKLGKHVKLKSNEGLKPIFLDKSKKKELAFVDGFYHCPECEFASTIKTSMERHLVSQHASWGRKVYGCQKCSVRTTNRYDFRRHVLSQRHKINNHIPDDVQEDLDTYLEALPTQINDIKHEIPTECTADADLLTSSLMGEYTVSKMVDQMIENQDEGSNDSTLLTSQEALKNAVLPNQNIFDQMLVEPMIQVKVEHPEQSNCNDTFDMHRARDSVLEDSMVENVPTNDVDSEVVTPNHEDEENDQMNVEDDVSSNNEDEGNAHMNIEKDDPMSSNNKNEGKVNTISEDMENVPPQNVIANIVDDNSSSEIKESPNSDNFSSDTELEKKCPKSESNPSNLSERQKYECRAQTSEKPNKLVGSLLERLKRKIHSNIKRNDPIHNNHESNIETNQQKQLPAKTQSDVCEHSDERKPVSKSEVDTPVRSDQTLSSERDSSIHWHSDRKLVPCKDSDIHTQSDQNFPLKRERLIEDQSKTEELPMKRVKREQGSDSESKVRKKGRLSGPKSRQNRTKCKSGNNNTENPQQISLNPILQSLYPKLQFYKPKHFTTAHMSDSSDSDVLAEDVQNRELCVTQEQNSPLFQISDVKGGLDNMWPECLPVTEVKMCSVAVQMNDSCFVNVCPEIMERTFSTVTVSQPPAKMNSCTQTSDLDWFMVEFETSFTQTIQEVL